ncbi:DNA internalization-related competence protein ComEC/Rec2 [Rhodoferax saidenbachensis]|uniref:DNA internalization-related competence protein ComEC/Rec2 n=1 Tax=Rhodoferax saidenbachensis TaxID=1484693 RepID=A0A1P8KBI9_9BURK|nr:DNA internalization-related competence protein ComEC/Rec2 [Rhodoferax saidenbachensis]APW43364.1 DNA internalization-related competence protein ComEC/Rec2 [Rhodoferax saidenbachensis]
MHGLAHFPSLRGQTLFLALAGLLAGTALQLQQSALWHWGVYALFVALALILLAQAATKKIANTALLVVAALVLGWGATGLRASAFLQHALDPALEGRDLVVTGVVTDMPQRNEAGLRFRLRVESAALDGQPIAVPPRIDVGWYAGVYPTGTELAGLQRVPDVVQAGERWRMTLRLKAPHGSRNPHGFDYELWLWEQGVQATAYVRAGANDPAPQRLGQTWRHPVSLVRQTVRDQILAQITPRQYAGLIAALVVGDQNAIDRVDWDVFRATGVAHLMSISGVHITMFAWAAALVLGWLWRRSGRLCRWWPASSAALAGGVLLAIAYSAFAGWGVPAQRTCVMLATIAALRLSGARWPWPQVWMLACAVVVALDPWALLQPGFWLSFVAVGVLFATDSGAGRAHSTRAGGRFVSEFSAGPPQGKLAPLGGSAAHAVASVGAIFREQWVITLALAPLTLLLFGQVSIVGLLANAFAIPWVTLVVTPLALFGVLVPGLWDVAAGAVGLLLAGLQWLAAFPWAALSVAMPPLWLGVAGVLGGMALVFPWSWPMRLLGLPLLLPVFLWQAPLPPEGQFELLAADVGQGNAVLVRTAHHALLYDAGPRYSLESDAGHRVLVPLLQALHTRLDTLVLSHRDADHVGGAQAVLAMQPQATLLSSIEPEHPLQVLRPAQRCVAGQQWRWDGVDFAVVHPRAEDYDRQGKPNALSCVLRISSGAHTALLVGDIEQAQEARLIADSADLLHSDVLLVPHHGSKTSSSAAFLDAVAPQFALMQSGYRNRFGHPAASVLQRYQERSIVVHDSPHCGAMRWQSWNPQNVACTRESSQRYWHHRVP